MQRTLILVKPDAFARGLTGEIIARFERKGLALVALNLLTMTPELAEQHYAEHVGKPFFEGLVEFITSAPLVSLVLEGERPIAAARQVIGATDPLAGGAGLDSRRLRARGGREHGPRLGLARVRRARDRAVLPGAGLSRWTGAAPDPRLALAAAPRHPRASWGSPSRSASPTSRSSRRVRRTRSRSRTRIARRRRWPRRRPGARVLGVDTIVALGGRIYGKPADADAGPRDPACALRSPRTRCSAACA